MGLDKKMCTLYPVEGNYLIAARINAAVNDFSRIQLVKLKKRPPFCINNTCVLVNQRTMCLFTKNMTRELLYVHFCIYKDMVFVNTGKET